MRVLPPGGGHRNDAFDEVRVFDRPLQDLHAAHGSADYGVEFGDTQVIEQNFLRANHVANRDERESEVVGFTCARIDRLRPGRPLAAADAIGANYEIPGGIDGLARADQAIPPAGFTISEGLDAGAMVVAG